MKNSYRYTKHDVYCDCHWISKCNKIVNENGNWSEISPLLNNACNQTNRETSYSSMVIIDMDHHLRSRATIGKTFAPFGIMPSSENRKMVPICKIFQVCMVTQKSYTRKRKKKERKDRKGRGSILKNRKPERGKSERETKSEVEWRIIVVVWRGAVRSDQLFKMIHYSSSKRILHAQQSSKGK